VAVSWIDIDPAELARYGEIKVALAEHPRGKQALLNVADSLRRIAAAGAGSIRGSVTRDDILVVSRSSRERGPSHPFLRGEDRILLGRDSKEFVVVEDSVANGRLYATDGPESLAFKMSDATRLETEILEGLVSEGRILYSAKSASPSSCSEGRAYARVQPTLPIGFAAHYESLPEMCARLGALAGINGGFFANFPEELSSHTVFNDPVGLLVIDGRVRCPPSFRRGTFVVSKGGSVSIETTDIHSLDFVLGGKSFSSAEPRRSQQSIQFGLNRASHEDATVYSSAFGSNSPRGQVVDFVISGDLVVEVKRNGGAQIPQNGFVLQIADSKLSNEILGNLHAARVADRLQFELHSDHAADGAVQAIAAGPVLVRDGAALKPDHLLPDLADEEFQRGRLVPTRLNLAVDDVKTRAPRSAIGLTRDRHILLVTVDDDRKINSPSDQRCSVGATLSELAGMMKELDCSQALNLDGGGSSTLWMGGEIKNTPSDGFARSIPNALLIVPASTDRVE